MWSCDFGGSCVDKMEEMLSMAEEKVSKSRVSIGGKE